MSHLDTLIQHCGTFAGHGINYEDQPFHGELILEPLLGERGITTWPSPTVVVDLPSPNGVGLIPVTTT